MQVPINQDSGKSEKGAQIPKESIFKNSRLMLHEIINSDDESQLEYTEPTYPEQQTLPSIPQNNEKIAKDEDALKDD